MINDNNSNFSYDETTLKFISASKLLSGFNVTVYNAATALESDVVMYKTTSKNAKWSPHIYEIIDGQAYYTFRVHHTSNRFLWVFGNSSSSGADVVIFSGQKNNGGFWTIEKAEEDYYYIKNITGTCLNVQGGSTGNATNVQTYICNQSDSQKFQFVPAD